MRGSFGPTTRIYIRAVRALIDERQLRDLRFWEHEDGVVLQHLESAPSCVVCSTTRRPTFRLSSTPASPALRGWIPAPTSEAALSSARDWKKRATYGKG